MSLMETQSSSAQDGRASLSGRVICRPISTELHLFTIRNIVGKRTIIRLLSLGLDVTIIVKSEPIVGMRCFSF
uniref:FeoA domain-containing protein n=1 Tax=Heterorhabditis bacteriophora TaxID=37862 RepID=A0A1I7WYE7_HETBA